MTVQPISGKDYGVISRALRMPASPECIAVLDALESCAEYMEAYPSAPEPKTPAALLGACTTQPRAIAETLNRAAQRSVFDGVAMPPGHTLEFRSLQCCKQPHDCHCMFAVWWDEKRIAQGHPLDIQFDRNVVWCPVCAHLEAVCRATPPRDIAWIPGQIVASRRELPAHAWLANLLSGELEKAISPLLDPARTEGMQHWYAGHGPDEYREAVRRMRKLVVKWILALCGKKGLGAASGPYYVMLFDRAIIRLFPDLGSNMEQETRDAIVAHDRALSEGKTVAALRIPVMVLNRLDAKYPGLRRCVESGFGYLAFIGGPRESLLVHEGVRHDLTFVRTEHWMPLYAFLCLYRELCEEWLALPDDGDPLRDKKVAIVRRFLGELSIAVRFVNTVGEDSCD